MQKGWGKMKAYKIYEYSEWGFKEARKSVEEYKAFEEDKKDE